MENMLMNQELQEELQDTPTGFCVDNDVKADWTLRKIAEIQSERDRMVNFHERQIEVTKAQAEIRINGRDYALNKAGLNVVVFNPSSGEMVDSSVISLSDGSDSLSHQ